jgi:2-polyprenyl-3-methyl-5-hydroxy-6-metoxy-1,4-benzoquinol methylase
LDERPPKDLIHQIKGHSERIDPQAVPAGILSIHSVRYEFAAPLCVNKKVLDVACGAGYGSGLLGHSALAVTGVDIEPQAVEYARQHYANDKVRFVVGDVTALAFPDASFDVVVSFETLEHVRNAEGFLREVQRVLIPDGTFVVSTPRVSKTNPKPENPHHVIEYAVEDFRALVSRHFTAVEFYGQVRTQSSLHYWLQKLDIFSLRRFIPASLRRATDHRLGTVPFEEMGSADQQIVKRTDRRASVVIAVCRRAED